MEGTGIFQFPDGKIYKGRYQNNQKHGFGVFNWPNGKKYSGLWKNGKQNGKGELLKDGRLRTGIFKNGKPIEWLSEKKES